MGVGKLISHYLMKRVTLILLKDERIREILKIVISHQIFFGCYSVFIRKIVLLELELIAGFVGSNSLEPVDESFLVFQGADLVVNGNVRLLHGVFGILFVI